MESHAGLGLKSGFPEISQANMNKQVNLDPAWQAMLLQPESQWDLCDAALLIAAQIQPELDVKVCQQQLESMAENVRSRIVAGMDEQACIKQLNAYFYDELGFSGDNDNYYLPDNSLLNKVIERRRGIPITLAVIYLKLANAAGLDAYGIGFPGHYLLGVHAEPENIILDPFDQGHILNRSQLRNMLQKLAHEKADDAVLEKNLMPAAKVDTVVRMLRNLKQIYIEAQQVESALSCIELILSLLPEAPDELRDRGMIYQHIEYSRGAIKDLTRYLELVPDAEERGVIEALLDSLESQRKSLH